MKALTVAVLVSAMADSVALRGGVAPDGSHEILLEADFDSPGYARYGLKGADDQFPAFLVVDRARSRALARLVWPGDPNPGETRLRERTEIIWRSDSAAVAVNTRDRFYSHARVLVRSPRSRRFLEVAIPPYEELSGHPVPPADKLLSRGHERAVRWTPNGELVFEKRLWGDVDYPLSYRVVLRLRGFRFEVQHREPIVE